MNARAITRNQQLEAALRSTSIPELKAYRASLVGDIQSISSALSEDKYEMLGERSDLLSEGLDTREAVIQASSSGNHQWRSRAIGAKLAIDRMLARVNARICELQVKIERSYRAEFVTETGQALADLLDDIIVDGGYIAVAIPTVGGTVIITKQAT